jgi:hypothetical protein
MITFEQRPVELVPIPKQIDLERISVAANQCQTNAYRVTRAHPEYSFVEGVIIIRDEHGRGDILAHAWNKNKAGHFDVTAPLWTSDAHLEIKTITYYPVIGFEASEMMPGGQFSKETTALVAYQQMIRDWDFKPGDLVVLFDPLSGKPVNHGVIDNYDTDTQFYHVKLSRLGNEFLFAWSKDHIRIATAALVHQANALLADVKLKSDYLLGMQRLKDRPMDTVLEIPLSSPPYLLYYMQMDVGGAIKWRLLTLKTHSED